MPFHHLQGSVEVALFRWRSGRPNRDLRLVFTGGFVHYPAQLLITPGAIRYIGDLFKQRGDKLFIPASKPPAEPRPYHLPSAFGLSRVFTVKYQAGNSQKRQAVNPGNTAMPAGRLKIIRRQQPVPARQGGINSPPPAAELAFNNAS